MDVVDQHTHSHNPNDRWDKVGIFLSGLCALHCLLTPLLVLALPMVGGYFEQPGVHATMALVVVPVGAFAFWSGYRLHQQAHILVLGLLGLLLIGLGSILPHEWVEFYGHDAVTIFGSFCLLGAHFLNRRACICGNH